MNQRAEHLGGAAQGAALNRGVASSTVGTVEGAVEGAVGAVSAAVAAAQATKAAVCAVKGAALRALLWASLAGLAAGIGAQAQAQVTTMQDRYDIMESTRLFTMNVLDNDTKGSEERLQVTRYQWDRTPGMNPCSITDSEGGVVTPGNSIDNGYGTVTISANGNLVFRADDRILALDADERTTLMDQRFVYEVNRGPMHEGSLSQCVELRFIGENTAPFIRFGTGDRQHTIGTNVGQFLGKFEDHDGDDGDTDLTYALQPQGGGDLPGYISFDDDPSQRRITINTTAAATTAANPPVTPPAAGTTEVYEMTATDPGGLVSVDTFRITYVDMNPTTAQVLGHLERRGSNGVQARVVLVSPVSSTSVVPRVRATITASANCKLVRSGTQTQTVQETLNFGSSSQVGNSRTLPSNTQPEITVDCGDSTEDGELTLMLDELLHLELGADPAPFVIPAMAPNNPPQLDTPVADVELELAEGLPLALTVPASTFSHPDNAPLTMSVTYTTLMDRTAMGLPDLNVGRPSWLTATVDGTMATFTGTPTAAGTTTVHLVVRDANGNDAMDMFDIIVLDTNNPPMAQPDTLAARAGGPSVMVNVLTGDPDNSNAGADSDPDGDDLAITGYSSGATLSVVPVTPGLAVEGMHGTLTIAADGTATYTPGDSLTAGTDVFTYRVADDRFEPMGDTATLTVTVAEPLELTVAATYDSAADSVTVTYTLSEDPSTAFAIVEGRSQGVRFTVQAMAPPHRLGQETARPGTYIFPLDVRTVDYAINRIRPMVTTQELFVVRDGSGAAGTFTVNVTAAPRGDHITYHPRVINGTLTLDIPAVMSPTNSPPTLENPVPDQTVEAGRGWTLSLADVFADADGASTLTLTGGPAMEAGYGLRFPSSDWLQLEQDSQTGAYSLVANTVGAVGSRRIFIVARDPGADGMAGNGDDAGVSDDFLLTVVADVEDPPMPNPEADKRLAAQLEEQREMQGLPVVSGMPVAIDEDAPWEFTFAEDTFTDLDQGETFTYSAALVLEGDDRAALPGWLNFNPAARTFSGSPPLPLSYTIEVTATDSDGLAATDSFSLSVTSMNDAPVCADSLPGRLAVAEEAFTFRIPAGTCTDEEGALTYAAAQQNGDALPGWLAFDRAGRLFSGNPPLAQLGDEYTIEVTVTDSDDVTASVSFRLRVVDSLTDERGRNVAHALSGFARNIGWETVDTVRGRLGSGRVAGKGAGGMGASVSQVDVSGLTQRARQHLLRHANGASRGWDATHAEAFGPGAGLGAGAGAFGEGVGAGAGVGGAGTGIGAGLSPSAMSPSAMSPSAMSPSAMSRMSEGGGGLLPQNLRLWANVSAGDLEFDSGDNLRFEGETLAARIGVERVFENGIVGLAVGRFRGELDFDDLGDHFGKGEVDVTQWTISPYFSREAGPTMVWGALSLGTGQVDYFDNYREDHFGSVNGQADTWMRMVAAGVEYDITMIDTLELVGRLEGMGIQLASEDDDSGANLFSNQDAETYGLRGEFEMGWNLNQGGVTYRPYVTAGYRWDAGGKGDEGAAAEYGAGLTLRSHSLTLDASARGQAGGDDDFDMRNYTVELGYDSGGDGMGLAVNLRNSLDGGPAFDPFASHVEYDRLGRATAREEARLGLETSYGVATRHGLLRPHVRADFDGGVLDRTGLGVSLKTDLGTLRLLHTLRLAEPGVADDNDEHAVELNLDYQF